jgi:hypothetical protein
MAEYGEWAVVWEENYSQVLSLTWSVHVDMNRRKIDGAGRGTLDDS